uniref:Phosphodiesterase n=1 Tax=Chrysolophus pictus TaxID=9089 RepID=A0A8C3LKF5_CHRPC
MHIDLQLCVGVHAHGCAIRHVCMGVCMQCWVCSWGCACIWVCACIWSLQDALLGLGAAIDAAHLQDALRAALLALLPRAEHAYIYLRDGDARRSSAPPPGELYDLDAASLQLKVVNYLKQETQSLCCCLLLVSEDNHQLFCQVVGDRVLEEEISFSLTFGRLGRVVEDKNPITLKDISEEQQQLSAMLGTALTSLLCVPVISRATSRVVALACALLQVAKNLFTHLGRRGHSAACMHALLHLHAFRHLDIQTQGHADIGIHGQRDTRTQGHPPPPSPDPAVSPEVIGVAELVNKINGPWFSKFDEDLATAFSIYCGISIAHSLLYKKVNEAQYRSHLANEMMMYHMKVSDDEYTKLLSEGIQPVAAIDPNFAHFTYTPRSLPEDDTSMAILSMLQDMNFINTYKMDRQTLTRFCLMVKKGYRDPPYHNWMHAFSVSHFCYLLYKNLELSNYLEDIEIFALFISCMCHDLDHRGTNNSFQVASKSVLAALYSSEGSVMERHHFAQAIAILNSQGCNIFDHFSRKDYQRMLDLMRDIILATDLAHHLRIFKDLQKMAEVGYDPKNKQHHSLLLCLLMTSCDLSDQTKGWKTTRKIAELIYKEFFSQGDLEKAMGNRPLEMMDREKAYIPELQISFMEHIAMPIYKLLQDLFPKASELYERVASNREQWTKVSHKFTIRGLPSNNSLDFLDEDYDPQAPDPQMNGCLDAEGHPESGAE